MMSGSELDSSITNRKEHLIIKEYIEQYQRPFVKLKNFHSKVEVAKDRLAEFEKWMERRDGEVAVRRAAMRRMASKVASFLMAVFAFASSLAAQEYIGTTVAIKASNGSMPYMDGKGFASMLNSDLPVTYGKACKGRVVEWVRRQDVLDELAFQQSRYVNPATRAPLGQLAQPDFFIESTISGDGGRFTYDVKVVDALSNEVVATENASVPMDKLVDAMTDLAKSLPEKLCKLTAGYTMSGRMDDASIKGNICGKLDKPFTATSPEVAGAWKFTPKNPTSGSFTYTAQNVGGVPGSGKGTYTIVKGKDSHAHIKLSGTGSIHSPLGTFSAAITESIQLTPVKSCGRVGNK